MTNTGHCTKSNHKVARMENRITLFCLWKPDCSSQFSRGPAIILPTCHLFISLQPAKCRTIDVSDVTRGELVSHLVLKRRAILRGSGRSYYSTAAI